MLTRLIGDTSYKSASPMFKNKGDAVISESVTYDELTIDDAPG